MISSPAPWHPCTSLLVIKFRLVVCSGSMHPSPKDPRLQITNLSRCWWSLPLLSLNLACVGFTGLSVNYAVVGVAGRGDASRVSAPDLDERRRDFTPCVPAPRFLKITQNYQYEQVLTMRENCASICDISLNYCCFLLQDPCRRQTRVRGPHWSPIPHL